MEQKPSLSTRRVKRVKRLIWDIEVSPNVVLAFRAGYDQNINHDAIILERKVICIGYKWESEDNTYLLVWDKNQDDKELLRKFLAVANKADELIAHYGDKFDLPWFRGRCLIHGFEPLPPYKTVDTKAWASKYFNFNSNKLDYLGSVLGYGKKDKMEFDDWKKILIGKCDKSLKKMCDYCVRDVGLLELVYLRLQPYMKPKTHAGVFFGHDKWSCSHCGSLDVTKSKTRVTANGTRQHQMLCSSCNSYSTISESTFDNYLEVKKKKGKGKRC
jgi:hypothetical protein